MTRLEIVNEVLERLNLTSTDARSRVEKRVQDRYNRISSTTGLITSRRVTKDFTIDPTTLSTLPDYRIESMEKVSRILRLTDTEQRVLLPESSYDEVTARNLVEGLPQRWGVKLMASNYVIITFDRTPTADSFSISVYGYTNILTLGDNDEPIFPGSFHDILVEGAMSDELRKLEKSALAQLAESKYESRLSDLRMFIAKSGYTSIYQGKTKSSVWPWESGGRFFPD